MRSRDIENAFARSLTNRGWNVRRTIEAVTKTIPFVQIETTGVEPIHAGSPVNRYSLDITLLGPVTTPEDEGATTATHLSLVSKLSNDIAGSADANGVIEDKWSIYNCYEEPPTIEVVNDTEYWASSFKVELI